LLRCVYSGARWVNARNSLHLFQMLRENPAREKHELGRHIQPRDSCDGGRRRCGINWSEIEIRKNYRRRVTPRESKL
jgi:hypothetical protein